MSQQQRDPSSFVLAPCLTHLPEPALERIWRELDRYGDRTDGQALRETCVALKQATAQHIHALHVRVHLLPYGPSDYTDDNEPEPDPDLAFQHTLQQLRMFPSDATLKRLRWTCWKYYTEDECSAAVCARQGWVVSNLLARIFSPALAPKIGSLVQLRMTGTVTVRSEDLTALARTCPLLEELRLQGMSLVGTMLRPLWELHSLRSLSLGDIYFHQGRDQFGPSLAGLTQLTKLEVFEKQLQAEDAVERLRFTYKDIMPYAKQLPNLQSLNLLLISSAFPDMLQLLEGGQLLQLTHLSIGHPWEPVRYAHGEEGSFEIQFEACQPFLLMPQHVAALSQMPRLASFQVSAALLSADAILALRHVTELRAAGLQPDRDLSSEQVPLNWRQLTLSSEDFSLRDLAWLPRAPHMSLCSCDDVVRLLLRVGDVADGGFATVAVMLRRACEVLVQHRQHHYDLGRCILTLLLCWDKPPPGPCHEVLSGLAPLQAASWFGNEHPGPNHLNYLVLADHWHSSAQDAVQLTTHLPGLKYLSLWSGPEMRGFEDFIPALASSMPGLHSLVVPLRRRGGAMATDFTSIQAANQHQLLPADAALRAVDTLRAMAVERACNGLALQIIAEGVNSRYAEDEEHWKMLCEQEAKLAQEFASRMGADVKCPVLIAFGWY